MKLLKLLKRKCRHRFFMLLMIWLTGTTVGLAQNITISGVVSDETGQPLAGASILEKSTSNGAQTDFDGKFTVNAGTNSTLVVSYLGFVTQEITISGKSTINVVLLEDKEALDEVVVIGYGTQKKSDLTGATSSISSDDILVAPVTNIGLALQGRAAGVSVISNSGSPGATPTY